MVRLEGRVESEVVEVMEVIETPLTRLPPCLAPTKRPETRVEGGFHHPERGEATSEWCCQVPSVNPWCR